MPPSTVKGVHFVPGLLNTTKLALLPTDTLVLGMFGAGKSHLGLTWSEFYQGPWNKVQAREVIKLSDLCIIGADKDAHATMAANRYSPGYYIDMWKLLQPLREGEPGRPVAEHVVEALGWVEQELAYVYKELGIRKLIIDTASTLQAALTYHFLVAFPRWKDNRKNYVDVNNQFYGFWKSVTQLGFRTLWLCHPRENTQEIDAHNTDNKNPDGDKAKAVSKGVAGTSNLVVPELVGKTQGLVIGNSSNELWLSCNKNNGKMDWALHPFGEKDAQGKSRYRNLLNDREPANLFELDNKIEKLLS